MAKTPGAETITVVRKPKVDKLSDEKPVATEHDIVGCVVLPRGSHEENRGWVIVDGKQVIAPYGADILASDSVRYEGQLWTVDGAPGDYKDRKGRGKATIFYLNRIGVAQ